MSERIVTTIGDLRAVGGPKPVYVNVQGRRPPPPPPRRRGYFSTRYDDGGIDGLMGIGEADGPIFIPPTGPAIAIPEPQAPGTTPAGSPPPAKLVKEAWLSDGRYTLQSSDTLWGLAVSYLGSGSRWRQIWDVQPAAYKSNHAPDRIFAGDVIAMPEAAQAQARKLGFLGIGSSVVGRGFTGKQVAVAALGAFGLTGAIAFFNR